MCVESLAEEPDQALHGGIDLFPGQRSPLRLEAEREEHALVATSDLLPSIHILEREIHEMLGSVATDRVGDRLPEDVLGDHQVQVTANRRVTREVAVRPLGTSPREDGPEVL